MQTGWKSELYKLFWKSSVLSLGFSFVISTIVTDSHGKTCSQNYVPHAFVLDKINLAAIKYNILNRLSFNSMTLEQLCCFLLIFVQNIFITLYSLLVNNVNVFLDKFFTLQVARCRYILMQIPVSTVMLLCPCASVQCRVGGHWRGSANNHIPTNSTISARGIISSSFLIHKVVV